MKNSFWFMLEKLDAEWWTIFLYCFYETTSNKFTSNHCHETTTTTLKIPLKRFSSRFISLFSSLFLENSPQEFARLNVLHVSHFICSQERKGGRKKVKKTKLWAFMDTCWISSFEWERKRMRRTRRKKGIHKPATHISIEKIKHLRR